MKTLGYVLAFICLFSSCQNTTHKNSINDQSTPPKNIKKNEPTFKSITLEPEKEIPSLIERYDLNKDFKITIKDKELAKTSPIYHPFQIEYKDKFTLKGIYQISTLLQELVWAKEKGLKEITLSYQLLTENPVDRLDRMIKEHYWDGLTRTIDKAGLKKIMADSKMIQDTLHIYVPVSDSSAYIYFSNLALELDGIKKIKVSLLPKAEDLDPTYVRSLDGRHGLLSLKMSSDLPRKAVPFVVPGGRFNEMYGWDSYFIVLGLLADGKVDLALSQTENILYQIEHYGKVLNANRSYYLTRSQPPFTTSLIRAVYEKLPDGEQRNNWLVRAMKLAFKEYQHVWMSENRYNEKLKLNRYYAEGIGPCPEVEPGHYQALLKSYATKEKITEDELLKKLHFQARKKPHNPLEPEELHHYFIHDRAVRESGHDTTYRFEDRAYDFYSVDLNSLLYKYESDFKDLVEAKLLSKVDFGSADLWKKQMNQRSTSVNKYLWSEKKGGYFDWDEKNKKQSTYQSATSFYPLWAKMASPQQVEALIHKQLPPLSAPFGLLASSKASRGELSPDRPAKQWDYPYGWAPHQMLLWQGLMNYGKNQLAFDFIQKWLKLITQSAQNYNGTVPEKFDIVKGSHRVHAEYGNQGVDFNYITKEGFGWMNASFKVGLGLLSKKEKEKLKNNFKLPPKTSISSPAAASALNPASTPTSTPAALGSSKVTSKL